MRGTILVIVGLMWLAGCGGGSDKDANGSAAGDAPSGEEAAGEAAAPAVEKADLDCGKFKPQTAPEGQAADDIVGLRQGMSEEQVRGVLLCKNPSYAINVSKSSTSLPDGGQMSRINLYADTGLDKVNVWLIGPPDGERLVHVDRTNEYPAGKELPVANIAQEVSAKYGAFDDSSYGNQRSGWIIRSRDGQRMANGNMSYSECRSHNIRTDKVLPCLHAISYEVMPNQQNPALAARFSVGLTSFAMMTQMAMATQAQQAKAVERAQESADEKDLDL